MLRRASAIVLALALVTLTLVTSGYACAVEGGAMEDMPGMSAALRPAPAPAAPTSGVVAAAAEHSAPAPPCDVPWTPRGCDSSVPCGPATLASEPVAALHAQGGATGTVPEWSAATLATRGTPPELPPPRA